MMLLLRLLVLLPTVAPWTGPTSSTNVTDSPGLAVVPGHSKPRLPVIEPLPSPPLSPDELAELLRWARGIAQKVEARRRQQAVERARVEEVVMARPSAPVVRVEEEDSAAAAGPPVPVEDLPASSPSTAPATSALPSEEPPAHPSSAPPVSLVGPIAAVLVLLCLTVSSWRLRLLRLLSLEIKPLEDGPLPLMAAPPADRVASDRNGPASLMITIDGLPMDEEAAVRFLLDRKFSSRCVWPEGPCWDGLLLRGAGPANNPRVNDNRTAGAVDATPAVNSPPAVTTTVQISLASLLVMPELTSPAPAAAQASPTVEPANGVAAAQPEDEGAGAKDVMPVADDLLPDREGEPAEPEFVQPQPLQPEPTPATAIPGTPLVEEKGEVDEAAVPAETATAIDGPSPVPDHKGDLVEDSSNADIDPPAAPVALPAVLAEGPEQVLEACHGTSASSPRSQMVPNQANDVEEPVAGANPTAAAAPPATAEARTAARQARVDERAACAAEGVAVRRARGLSGTLNKSLTKCDEWVQLCVDIKKGRADEEEIRWRGRDCVIRAGDWRRVLTNNAKKAEAHDDDFKLIYLTLTLILALWNHPRGLGDLVPDPVEGEDVKKLTAGQQVELISKVLAYRRERTARYARLAGDVPLCGQCGLVTAGDQLDSCICQRALTEEDREELQASLHVLVDIPNGP